MSKVLVRPPEVNIKEEQSLAQAQEMLLSVFSSIAYIRDLFSEDSYEDAKLAGMQTKRLKKGHSPQVTQLLNWIENGCFDALQKKYLETVVFGIFEDPNNPTTMLETYTLHIDYPSSKIHTEIRASNKVYEDVKMSLTVKKAGNENEKIDSSSGTFQREIVTLLRSLCVLTQTLGPLPEKRYLTMQITYYDELTPREYEPPGFSPLAFDINYIFKEPTMKHVFGSAKSGHHLIGLNMETTCMEPADTEDTKSEALVPATLGLPAVPLEAECELTQTPNIADETQPTLVKSIAKVEIDDHALTKNTPDAVQPPKDTQVIRCSCEDNETDLDMIQCDYCGTWQHTPCVGYCSNRDKRIPKDSYKCYTCRYGHSKKIMLYLKNVSCFRRVIAVLFTDGFKSIAELATRLSCPITRASNLIKRLEDEGLLAKVSKGKGSGYNFSPCSGQAVKDKLNHYFGPDPEAFADFPDQGGVKRKAPQQQTGLTESKFQVAPLKPIQKRRKSEASLKIDA